MSIGPPELLQAFHVVDAFDCGEPVLDEWLKRRALGNQTSGASRTFVVANDQRQVVGYYALAAGAVAHQDAVRSVRQNMPNPIPVMVLARLAVHTQEQRLKLGASLLQDAVRRSVFVAESTGVRAIVVHALNDRARQFYEHYGFKPSPIHAMTLMLPLPR